jgi:small subunit ribosomal protein S9
MKTINTVGTRKKSVARAVISDGNGTIRINSRPLGTVEPALARMKIEEPVILAGEISRKCDIDVSVIGGGVTSQAEAARLAIAKALAAKNAKLREEFLRYDRTLLVADVRQRESRKPNRHGNARGKTQKSYR